MLEGLQLSALLLLLMVAVSLCYSQSTNTTYLIKPNDSTPCPPTSTHTKCLTLEQYARDNSPSGNYTQSITLQFMPGIHPLSTNFEVKYLKGFTMHSFPPGSLVSVVCTKPAGLFFIDTYHLLIEQLHFDSCGLEQLPSTIYVRLAKHAELRDVTITNSTGTALRAYNSSLLLHSTIITHCGIFPESGTINGGALNAYNSEVVLSGITEFSANSASSGGAIFLWLGNLTISGSARFTDNAALSLGGAMCLDTAETVELSGNVTFVNSSAQYGGAIAVFGLTNRMNLSGIVTFTENVANTTGNAMYVQSVPALELSGTVLFKRNQGIFPGYDDDFQVIPLSDISVSILNLKKIGQRCPSTLVMNEMETIQFSGDITFLQNLGICGAFLIFNATTLDLSGNTSFVDNSGYYGTLMAYNITTIVLSGNTTFLHNSAYYGGAMWLLNTTVQALAKGTSIFSGNHANIQGGALALDQTVLDVQSNTSFVMNNNTAKLSGGALFTHDSVIKFNSTVEFIHNSASEGGAYYLSGRSNFVLGDTSTLHFINNRATQKGGALYVEAGYQCTPYLTFSSNCFFAAYNITTHLVFNSNTATSAGSVLYGGQMENCTDGNKPYSLYDISNIENKKNSNVQSNIASDPFIVCPCINNTVDCSTVAIQSALYPGQTFNISVVTVGQRNGVVPSSVQTSLEMNADVHLGALQSSQKTKAVCSNLKYTVFSRKNHTIINLTVGGKCSVVAPALQINISFLDCPTGFELSGDPAKCVCQQSLQQYTKECTIDDQKIHRKTDFWVGYDNSTQGLILHPHCPFDYCVSPPNNFTTQNSDLQCNYNRTKLLCGQCRAGLSLALGTSTCLDCSNYYLALLLAFALAGLALVFLLFACRLTVAKGTLSGIIFYANIVHSNQTLFFPPGQTNILTVFVAWLNLDLGIQTCFYDGMDTYARTWLQFLFPTYVFMLCGLIVLASKKSRCLSRALGTNPVAVLATLFLLSYTKLLRTAIATLSFATLSYPHDHTRLVWLYDANIGYLHGKHIPLFVVGLATLLLCLPYTLLLLTNQWLRALSNYRLLYWVNSPRVKFFLDAYNAPFKTKHCYWTGLLLLARLILLIVSATNQLGDPTINLLVICIITVLLGILQWVHKGTYKHLTLDVVEALMILNLNILSTNTLYINLTRGNQAAITYTSAALFFVMFISVLLCHGYLQIKTTNAWNSICVQRTSSIDQAESSDGEKEDSEEPSTPSRQVTHSEITLSRLVNPVNYNPPEIESCREQVSGSTGHSVEPVNVNPTSQDSSELSRTDSFDTELREPLLLQY